MVHADVATARTSESRSLPRRLPFPWKGAKPDMSETLGRKRLQPRMGRGGWRFTMWVYVLQVLCSGSIAAIRLTTGLENGLNAILFYLCLLWFLMAAGAVLYFVRVRRNDEPFWDAEEARRADFDRRGRQF